VSATAEVHEIRTGQQRRWRGRNVVFAALIFVLALGGVAFWRSQASGKGHRLLYTQTVPDGRVFRCFSDGSALGSAGTEVGTGDAPAVLDGSESGPAIVVRPPGYNEEQARRAAEEYRKSGRSVEKDKADLDRLSAECKRRR
jgi:hypothetical protein